MEALKLSFHIEWSAAGRALAGERQSGDQYIVEPFPGGVLVAVVDGLGHGDEAAQAALAAVKTMRAYASDPVIALVWRCHEALRRTRGAVLSLAALSASNNTMTWIGVGNVEGVLYHSSEQPRFREGNPLRERLLLRGGVVGYQLPPLRETMLPISPGDLLVLTTDGILNNFSNQVNLNLPVQTIADQILAEYSRETDDALALAVRYLG